LERSRIDVIEVWLLWYNLFEGTEENQERKQRIFILEKGSNAHFVL